MEKEKADKEGREALRRVETAQIALLEKRGIIMREVSPNRFVAAGK